MTKELAANLMHCLNSARKCCRSGSCARLRSADFGRAITNEGSTSEQEEDMSPKPPVTLTDMPDEILLRIFHYLQVLDAVRTPRGTPKLRYLYINKRLYQMARPKWYEHIELAFDKQGNNRTLMERLLWAADIHPFVKSVKVTLSNSELAQEAVVISVLSNVRHLEVSIEPASWTNGAFRVPDEHDEVLAGIPSRFPHLEEFRSSNYTSTHDNFLECLYKRCLPPRLALFEVRLYDNCLVSRPLPRSPKLDITICLPDTNPPQVGLHWHMLTHLKIDTALSEVWSKWLLTSVEAGVSHFRPACATSAYEVMAHAGSRRPKSSSAFPRLACHDLRQDGQSIRHGNRLCGEDTGRAAKWRTAPLGIALRHNAMAELRTQPPRASDDPHPRL